MFSLFIRLSASSLINAGSRHSSQHGAYLAHVWRLENKRQDDSDLAVAYLRHLPVNNSNESGHVHAGNAKCYKCTLRTDRITGESGKTWQAITYNVTSRRVRVTIVTVENQ